MKTFRTYQMAKELYRRCQAIKLTGAQRDQFDRALLSIPLNLAEGSAKPSVRDRKRFYFTALGSLREVQTILDLHGTDDLVSEADRLAAHLHRLCHSYPDRDLDLHRH